MTTVLPDTLVPLMHSPYTRALTTIIIQPPCARLTGTIKDSISDNSDSKTNMLPDTIHQSQCVPLSQPRIASYPLSPKALSQPGTHLTVPKLTPYSPNTCAPQTSSALSPLSTNTSTPLTISAMSPPHFAPHAQAALMMKQSPSVTVTPHNQPSTCIQGYP